jgi:hypothetical protein
MEVVLMAKRAAKGLRKDRDFSDIIEQACDRDRIYFEKHPDTEFYMRRSVPGEFWPVIFPYEGYVGVQQISPGFRLRSPYLIEKTGTIGDETWKKLLEEGTQILEVFNEGGDT